jgi:hypothetical protein
MLQLVLISTLSAIAVFISMLAVGFGFFAAAFGYSASGGLTLTLLACLKYLLTYEIEPEDGD